MCMLCVEIRKGSMTPREVARAYREVTDSDHSVELTRLIIQHSDVEAVAKELNEIYQTEL